MKTFTDLLETELRARIERIVNPSDIIDLTARTYKEHGHVIVHTELTVKVRPDGGQYKWGETMDAGDLLAGDGLEKLVSKLIDIAMMLQGNDMLPKR